MSYELERTVLTTIAKQNDGILQVDDVLAEASNEDSPLHKHFEWDDSVAAEQHRRYQARVLIQKCHITLVESEPTKIRAFVSLQADRDEGGGYRLTTSVMSDEELREELLHEMGLTIARWTRKLHLLDSLTTELILQLENQVTPKKVSNVRRIHA